jgi:hypothetical protein
MTVRADRRQLILDRLAELLPTLSIELSTGVIPVKNFVRNRDELPQELVPGIILLDADESRDPRFPDNTGRNVRSGPGMMKMLPEVYVVLEVRKPHNLNVGQDLNVARAAIVYAVTHDDQLDAICGSSGGITFEACITDLARNRQMRGQMGLSFTFSYPFIPDELKAI